MDNSINKDLYVDLSKIIKMTDSEIPVTLELPICAFSDNEISFATPISVNGHIVNMSNILTIKAILKFSVHHQCDRCLTAFIKDYEIEFSDEIANESSTREADEYIPYSNSRVLLTEAVYKCVFSEMDIKNICKPDCKGLCGKCGADLNEKSCDCREEEIDPRLLKLKELLK